jgi:hypothetical protein
MKHRRFTENIVVIFPLRSKSWATVVTEKAVVSAAVNALNMRIVLATAYSKHIQQSNSPLASDLRAIECRCRCSCRSQSCETPGLKRAPTTRPKENLSVRVEHILQTGNTSQHLGE